MGSGSFGEKNMFLTCCDHLDFMHSLLSLAISSSSCTTLTETPVRRQYISCQWHRVRRSKKNIHLVTTIANQPYRERTSMTRYAKPNRLHSLGLKLLRRGEHILKRKIDYIEVVVRRPVQYARFGMPRAGFESTRLFQPDCRTKTTC